MSRNAKCELTSLEVRLLATRSRMIFRGAAEGTFLDATHRFERLSGTLERLGADADPELYRHFPVAAIATLEGHFKQVVAAIVDGGEEYFSRGISLAKERLKATADVIPLLHRRAITIGELVAELLPFSTLGHLEDTFSKLLGLDFKMVASRAVDPYHARNEVGDAPVLISDVQQLWRDLHETFERRHILAHETAPSYAVSYKDALTSLESCRLIADVTEAVLWSGVWKSVPLTQYEMNAAARAENQKSRDEFVKSLWAAFVIATKLGQRGRFRRSHLRWKNDSVSFTLWGLESFQGASMRPLLLFAARETATRNRKAEVDEWIAAMSH